MSYKFDMPDHVRNNPNKDEALFTTWLEQLAEHGKLDQCIDSSAIHDARGIIDTVFIDEVTIIGSTLNVQYSYEWSASYTCSGLNDGDYVSELIVEVSIVGDAIIFPDPPRNFDQRSTYEEF